MGFIKFIGTAGARFVMIKQLRSSGGIWLNYKSTNIIIDPGPGSIVRCNKSRPPLDLGGLDAIVLTHKHLDHSGDLNVMVEAMTEGGFRRRGILFAPADSVGEDGVLFSYLKNYLDKIIFLEQGEYSVKDLKFAAAVKNFHSVETYGLKFFIDDSVVSFVSDTKYFDGLVDIYRGSTVLVLNVVFYQPRKDYDHLSLPEAVSLIKKIKPKLAVFTHFGMTMLKAKPRLIEKEINKELPQVKFAYDGFSLEIPLK
ncbi:MAG: MBL fold metallo-hydrolase [Candidatus Omnitrophota bacterium]